MKSKMSFFNKTIFFKGLTGYWPIWALYLVIWIFIMPVTLSNELSWGVASLSVMNETILYMADIGGLICAAIGSVAAAAAVYSFMYTGRSTNFYASLPIRREGLFLTSYLSGIAWFVASNVIIVLLTMMVQAAHGMLSFYGLLHWFAITTLQMIVFYGIATFCASVAGNIWGFGILYAALNCVPIICEAIIKYIGTLILRGVSFSENFFTRIITPVYQLWDHVFVDYNGNGDIIALEYQGWTGLLIWAAVGLILAGIGLALYRHRHMETASDFISVKPLRPVVKYCATAVCALGLGLLLYEIVFININVDDSTILLTLCMLMGAFVGYFASSMMLAKSFRVFKKWGGFAVSALVIILLMTVTRMDIFGIEGYIPKAENVEKVFVNYYYEGDNIFTERDDIADVLDIHSTILEDDIAVNTKSYYADWNGSVSISYVLKNGRTVNRDYYIYIEDTNTEIYKKLDALLNDGETILNRIVGDTPVNEQTVYNAYVHGYDYTNEIDYSQELTSEEALELYETSILPDIKDGTLGYNNIGWFKNDSAGYIDCYVSIELLYLDENGEEIYNSIYLQVSSDAVRTVKALEEMGIPLTSLDVDNTSDVGIIGGADGPTEVVIAADHNSF